MESIEALFQMVTLSESKQHTVSKILSLLAPDILTTWLEKLQIKDARIAGTFYAELASRLAYSDFVALYEALGYDFDQPGIWKDWWCYGAEHCKRQSGYTCDPKAC